MRSALRHGFIPSPDPPPLAGKHGATPPHGTTHHPRPQETEEVPSLNKASCSKTVQAVKRCSSLFRFGGVPCPARASRAAAKKISTLRVVFFLRRPCRPPRYGAWNRRQHAPSVVTRGFPCAPRPPFFSGALRASFQGGAVAAFVIARRRVASLVAAGKAAMKHTFLIKVTRRICLCHLTARRPHAALDDSVFSQRATAIKRNFF